MNPGWLMRMFLWVRNPPSAKRRRLVLAVVVGGLIIFALEHFGLWPEALTVERVRY